MIEAEIYPNNAKVSMLFSFYPNNSVNELQIIPKLSVIRTIFVIKSLTMWFSFFFSGAKMVFNISKISFHHISYNI